MNSSNGFQKNELGWIWEDDKVLVFFGGKESSKEKLHEQFPKYILRQIKQTHSIDVVVDKGQDLTDVEGDGLVTTHRNLALCILTADCVPVMIHEPFTDTVTAIHAGWRGVAGRLVPEALALFDNYKNLRIWIGPHIGKQSFEVKQDALDLLLPSSTATANEVAQKTGTESYLVDLYSILVHQLAEFSIEEKQITRLDLDSKTDLLLHSHRRDAAKAGRQNSFIVLK